MKIDILLVGPWDRIKTKVDNKIFENYIKDLKKKKFVNNIIYSSSDKSGPKESNLFDEVLFNQLDSNIVNNNFEKNGLIYYQNLSAYKKINLKADFVLKIRSDIYLKNLDFLYALILENKNQIIIDYYVDHSLLIPYYYSDFMILCKSNIYVSFFDKKNEQKYDDKKKLTFSPHKSIYAGRINENQRYTEQFLWSNFLGSYKNTDKFYKPQSKLNIFDYFDSLNTIKKNFIFISRSFIYSENDKFKYRNIINKFIYKNNQLDLSFTLKIFLFFYHYLRFFYLTFDAIYKKYEKK
jgi:hypothetical protein